MKCEETGALLDQLLDGTLSNDQLQALEAHGQSCPACGEQIRAAMQMKALFNEMEPEVDVPLRAQAAWRGAVKAEARRKKIKRFYSWAGVAAAAVVLVVGVSLGLNGRNAPKLSDGAASMGAVEKAEGAPVSEEIILEDGAENAEPALFEDASVARLEADGADVMAGAAAPQEAVAFSETAEADEAVDYEAEADFEAYDAGESASGMPMHQFSMRVESVDAACEAIADLVSEYEGTADIQRQDGAANLYITLSSENVFEFISAIAHLDVSGEAPEIPDLSGETTSALLLALTE